MNYTKRVFSKQNDKKHALWLGLLIISLNLKYNQCYYLSILLYS